MSPKTDWCMLPAYLVVVVTATVKSQMLDKLTEFFSKRCLSSFLYRQAYVFIYFSHPVVQTQNALRHSSPLSYEGTLLVYYGVERYVTLSLIAKKN